MNDKTPVEVLLDRFVDKKSLAPGALLPPIAELARELKRSEQAIRDAIQSAAKKGKLELTADGGAVVALPAVKDGAQLFSFSVSAAQSHERLVTSLVEPPVLRLPLADEDHPLYLIEQRAQSGLDLARGRPFIVIFRVRHLHGRPQVFHRVYLDPARFPAAFLDAHDFASESLIDIYGRYGYRLQSRDTVLHARLANLYESAMLGKLGQEPHSQAVLHAEQRFFATSDERPEPFPLEYMQATYFDHFQYSIPNRPAPIPRVQ
jgi:DNA-binding GntR family transcriptional regulator